MAVRCRTLAIMTDDPDPDDVQIEALRQEITHDLYVLAAMTRETEAKAIAKDLEVTLSHYTYLEE